MGWFNEQIKERIRRDDESFSDAMEEISSIITRKPFEFSAETTDADRDESITSAIHQILRYYRFSLQNFLMT